MNDVEHDLRELLDRKASSVGTVAPKLPEHVRKRSRRRELGTVLVSGITVVALVIGSLAAVRALSEGTNRTPTPAEDPWAGYEVFERTAKVGNFTITSPSDWYLVNQFPWARTLRPQLQKQQERDLEACADEPTPEERRSCRSGLMGVPGDGYVVPLLMLSDTDRGLESSPCFDRSFSVAPDEAVMTVALDEVYFVANFGAGDRARWPVPFDTPPADDRLSCGPGTYVYFAANDIPYVAHFAFGESVSEGERQTLIASFEGMRVEGGQEFLVEELQPDDRAAYVIAGGENAAGPWTLELRRSTGDGPSANVELSVVSPEGEMSAGDFSVPDDAPIEQAGGDPTFGAVTKEASGVELRLEEGTPTIPAQVVPLPPSMPFDFDLFFASNDSDVPATAVALDDDGAPIATSTPATNESSLRTFLDDVDHLEPNDFWAPPVKREGERVVMPVTFPDGATAELVYPATLALERLSVYPDAFAALEGRSSSCDWPVHASRYDPRDGWLKGVEPLDSYVNEGGRAFELWKGPGTQTYLITRAGPWNVIVLCGGAKEVVGSLALWADLFSPRASDDGLLVLETTPPLALQLADEGATIRLSNRDVVVDVSSGRTACQARSPDMGFRDDVIQWCIDPAEGVYVYATAFRQAGTSILEGLVEGLEVRNYRAAPE